MGVEYSLSSHERFIGSVALGTSSSSRRNVGVISAMAFFLKYRFAVVEEKSFELKQLIWLKIKTMNEDLVKFWRIFVGEISRVFAFC